MKPRQAAWHVERASRSLVLAAAALDVPTPENKATALMHAGIALLHLANSDPKGEARDLAVRLIAQGQAAL